MQQDPNASPFNALPRAVVILAVAITLVELAFQANEMGFVGAPGMRILMLEQFSFPANLLNVVVSGQGYEATDLTRIVTYSFFHSSITQAIFALVFVLALGKFVGEVFEGWAVFAVFFGSAIFGAFIYGAFVGRGFLYGAYPGAYGLIGAYTFLLWVGLGASGQNQMQAFTLIGFLLGIQLLFGLIFGTNNHWIAEVAGFLMGFALSTIVSPGGWQRFLRKIRERR